MPWLDFQVFELSLKWDEVGMVIHTSNPHIQGLKQEDFCKFQARLG